MSSRHPGQPYVCAVCKRGRVLSNTRRSDGSIVSVVL